MKSILTAFLLCGATLIAQSTPARNHVRRIFVNEFQWTSSTPEGAGSLIRSKLVSALAEACASSCTVVESVGATADNGQDIADAVLTGTIQAETRDNRRYRVQGAMQLLDKDGNVLWAGTIYSSPFARSASSSFADNTAKKITSFRRSLDQYEEVTWRRQLAGSAGRRFWTTSAEMTRGTHLTKSGELGNVRMGKNTNQI